MVTINKRHLISAVAALTFSLAAASAQAQSFTNFGFETPNTTGFVQGGNSAGQLGAGAYDAGWNFTGGFIGHNGNAYGPGTAPEGTQVAMLQNVSSFSQSLGFAQAGSYQISFQAAQRANNSQLLSITMDGTTILPSFAPTGGASVTYNPYQTATFNVTAGQHAFTFNGLGNSASNGGDNTVFIDKVQLVAQQAAPQTIAISNPSFETYNNGSGVGYGGITGWSSSGTGGTGTNRGNNTTQTPFTDQKLNPDGGEVAFIQGTSTLSQNLTGFTIGQQYVLTFFADSRNGNTAGVNVTLGAKQLFSSAIAVTSPQYTFVSQAFTYDGTFNSGLTNATLAFAQTAAGDNTLLLDGVQITAVPAAAPEPSSVAALAIGMLGLGGLALRSRKRVSA